jgi:hypothetical protein
LFHQKCLILQTKIEDPKTPLFLGFCTNSHVAKLYPFLL